MIYVIPKKGIKYLLITALVLLSSFSVGYAFLNQSLNINGEVSVLPSPVGTIVSGVTAGTFTNNATESSNSSYTGSSVSLGVTLPKVNSVATYKVSIKNNGTLGSRFVGVESTVSNDAFTYSISGIDTSTILGVGEEIECIITIYYNDTYKYSLPSSTSSSLLFAFNFSSTNREALKSLTGSISPDSGDITYSDNGALFSINISNPNDFPVTYTLEGENGFVVYNGNGNIASYYLGAKESTTFDIYINDSTTSVASGTSVSVNVIAKVEDYDEVLSNVIDTVKLTLEDKNKYVVIAGGGGIKATPSDIDYSNINSSTSGIYAANDGNGYTYYYRGNVVNNYFSFGGFTWRIIRIDSSGNVRLILNDYIRSSNSVVTKSFKSSYSASSLDSANTLVKFVNDVNTSTVNSPMYGSINSTDATTLRGWYNTNLKSYEDYILDSKFCLDTTGGYAVSSGTNVSVFYYGPYHRIGVDAGLYSPDFTCSNDDTFIDKIGLLSADEFVFAGGAFRKASKTFFLTDFGNSTMWWTLSPAYYDSDQGKVGAFAVLADGSINDWIDGNTVTNAGAIRPVITVDGNKIITGSGSASDPYVFK